MSTVIGRRSLLRVSAGAALVAGSLPLVAGPAGADSSRFAHGVASGDPLPDGMVLWTRVTPSPGASPGSGVGPPVDVGWEVATDPDFTAPVTGGTVRTGPERDHTVHVDVDGLAPDTRYWFRFTAPGATSPVGRFRTAPAEQADVPRLRFGVVSCSNWQAGYFAAYRYLAERGDLDAVVHLGDYLYEYAPGEYDAREVTVRPHEPAREMVALADYRARHGQYKTDPDLQALHAAAPWVVTLDDHESANDAWRYGAENHQPDAEGDWTTRRAAALQAYREWMPVRADGDRLYRRLRFGRLAELSMLDLRSYRDRQAEPTGDVDDPGRTITGDEQLDWLVDGLTGTDAQWKLVGNPVVIVPVVVPPLPQDVAGPVAEFLGLPAGGVPINTDQWDGYTADRRRIVDALHDDEVRDTVFLTGDIHSSWASDLPLDVGTYPASPSVATEFVATSVTSDNLDDITGSPPRTTSRAVEAAFQADNRHIRYLEFDSHGASVLDVTPDAVQMDWYYVDDRTRPDATLRLGRSYRTRSGTQQVEPASSPAPSSPR